MLALWDESLQVPDWDGAPLWLHGDLHPTNVLVHAGRLSAVIDFGDITAGDPATDLSVAWMMFDASQRPLLRAAAGQRERRHVGAGKGLGARAFCRDPVRVGRQPVDGARRSENSGRGTH